MAACRAAIVFGGRGALGSAICSHLRSNLKFGRVVSVDFNLNQDSATDNIILGSNVVVSASDKYNYVRNEVKKLQLSFDLISVCAGGFTMGHVKDSDIFNKLRVMADMCLEPAVMAASLSFEEGVMKRGGLVILTGAYAAISATSSNNNMMAYGLAKASTHFLASTISTDPLHLKNNVKVFTIAPMTIDTPGNRRGMPGADPSMWTKPYEIALKYEHLLKHGAVLPSSGRVLGVEGSGDTLKWTVH